MKIINSVIKWVLFSIVLIIQAGAFMEGEIITGLTGALFCFVLTLSKDSLGSKLKIGKIYISFFFFLVFLVGAWIDMSLV